MGRLNGKVAVVTGASKGIGAGIARAMGREGAAVVVNFSSSKESAGRVVGEIVAAGGKAIAVGADVSQAADVARLFAETQQAFGAPNVLVNNAGVFAFGPFADVTEESFHWHFNVNVLGTVLMMQAALKHFPAEGGSIVNISSIVGSHARPLASNLWSDQRGGRQSHSLRGPGSRRAEHPGERDRARSHEVGRVGLVVCRSERRAGGGVAAQTDGDAGRHRPSRGVPGVGRFGMDHGRSDPRRRRRDLVRAARAYSVGRFVFSSGKQRKCRYSWARLVLV